MKRIVETKRLYLREFTPDDARKIFELNSNPLVMKYMPAGALERATLEQCASMIEQCIHYYSSHPGLGMWPTILK